ncbi:hypothetical protein O8I36_05390 [Campylobacter lari]|uniref:hypothetical protein n=1 Tax=Campylobacter lari TaxID=201 RepID=UPI00372B4597
MSNAISEYIELLRKWKERLSIREYDYNKYNCEISELIKFCKMSESYSKEESEKIFDFWSDKFSQSFFELKHPEFNHINTRAVFSLSIYTSVWGNCVFMIDKSNSYPWMLIQMYHLGTAIVTQSNIYRPYYTAKEELCLIDEFVKEYDQKNIHHQLLYRDELFCINLNAPRPYHYFEQLSSFFPLLKKNQYFRVAKHSFFFPKKLQKGDEQNVKIYPCVFGRDGIIHQKLFNSCIDEVVRESLIEKKQSKIELDYELTIWLGLPGERRAWLEQIEGTANILKHLNKYFNKIKIYIDGMTAYDREKRDFPENKILFDRIVNEVRKLFVEEYNKSIVFDFEELQKSIYNSIIKEERFVVFQSLSGCDYRTKICYCNECDIAISDSGTTVLVPFCLYKKPGVLFYGNKEQWYVKFSRGVICNDLQTIIDDKFLLQVDKKSWYEWNFHIPWQHIYNLTVDVLEKLSYKGKIKKDNLRMHRLDVPPVELIAKQYELEQTLKTKFSMESVILYNEIEKQINTLVLHSNATLNRTLENFNTNNALSSTLQHFLQTKDQTIQNLENKIKDMEFKLYFKTAKARIQNQLSYKLGQAIIVNSKSILGYIRMPFVLSYIKDKHKQEQKAYQEKIKKDPSLALPPLESYPDYKESLKEKECFTYKLGQALMQANKTWYRGGYIKMWFEVRRLKKEFNKK